MVAAPGWSDVELLLKNLADSGESFSTTSSKANRISRYEPGRRVRLETESGESWVDLESIQGCWETLERLGRIKRTDVLDPGRCSTFMMALFARVEGVREEDNGELSLHLGTR